MSRVHLKNHCEECRQRQELCICQDIPVLETDVRLMLVVHYGELKTTSNTGRITAKCFKDHQILVRGLAGKPTGVAEALKPGFSPVLLYPGERAQVLGPSWREKNPGPIQLIVPDGTWRQASKIPFREPGLKEIPMVTLPEGEPTRYRLRSEPHPGHLCTGEAIARAMEWIEPQKGTTIRNQIETLITLHQNRILFSRGEITSPEAQAFLPKGYRRPG
ncbi:MAG: DTW domain-containing protein [Bdellovibrionales bacterium]|nr:DTW domain-containing protein [Bdellovibrionales bacterium]